MNEEQRISRRTFLDWLLAGGLLTWAVAFVAPVMSYLWPAQRRGPSVQTVSAGKEGEFAEWQTKIVAIGGHPVIVIPRRKAFARSRQSARISAASSAGTRRATRLPARVTLDSSISTAAPWPGRRRDHWPNTALRW